MVALVESSCLIDGIAQGLDPFLLGWVEELPAAPDPGQRDHPVALGDAAAVGRDEVRGGFRQEDGARRQLFGKRADKFSCQILRAAERTMHELAEERRGPWGSAYEAGRGP